MNALTECWVQSIKQECLDHFVIFGEAHLRQLVAEYVAHYNEERPHQGKDNDLLSGIPDPPILKLSAAEIVCDERLGGLLKHYRPAA